MKRQNHCHAQLLRRIGEEERIGDKLPKGKKERIVEEKVKVPPHTLITQLFEIARKYVKHTNGQEQKKIKHIGSIYPISNYVLEFIDVFDQLLGIDRAVVGVGRYTYTVLAALSLFVFHFFVSLVLIPDAPRPFLLRMAIQAYRGQYRTLLDNLDFANREAVDQGRRDNLESLGEISDHQLRLYHESFRPPAEDDENDLGGENYQLALQEFQNSRLH